MKRRLDTLALALPPFWARVYTKGLSPELRGRRLAEIECDVFEQQSDRGLSAPLALDVLVAVIQGIPDDLAWRLAHLTARGRLAQALAAGILPGLAVAWFTYHITQRPGAALGAGLVALAAVAFAAGKEPKVELYTSETQRRSGPGAFVLAAAVLGPALLIAGSITSADYTGGGDPMDDQAWVEAAGHTTRWITGYLLSGAGLALALVALLAVGGGVRSRGSRVLGSLPCALATIGVAGMLVAGHGMRALGLAAVLDMGGDGEAFLTNDVVDSVSLAWVIGGVLIGVALLMLAAGVWRTAPASGWRRIGAVAAFVLGGLAVAAVPAIAPGPGVSLVFPACLLAGFAFLLSGQAAASQAAGGFTSPTAPSPV
jgi:hypothetical protein